MKLPRHVYHLNTFHLLKTEVVNRRGAGGAYKKNKKCQEFTKVLTLISLKKFIKCYKTGDFSRLR